MAKAVLKLSEFYDSHTTKELFEEYMTNCRIRQLREATIYDYDYQINLVTQFYDINMPITEVDFKEVYSKVTSDDRWTTNSKATILNIFCLFIKWINREYDYNLPTYRIKREDTVIETFTDEELLKLIKKPKKFSSFAEYRNWLICSLLIDTGIRISTLVNIKIQDIDFERCSLTTTHNKNHKVQLLPLSRQLTREIKVYLNSRKGKPDDYLFPSVLDNKLTPNIIYKELNKYYKKKGVNKTGVHIFRHTYARRFIQGGGNVFLLQKQLGHSDLNMTLHYCHIFDEDLFENNHSQFDSLQNHKIKL